MEKEESKNIDQQKQNQEIQPSHNELNEKREQPVHHDRSGRHLSEIDRREGEMNHGETGLRQQDQSNDQ